MAIIVVPCTCNCKAPTTNLPAFFSPQGSRLSLVSAAKIIEAGCSLPHLHLHLSSHNTRITAHSSEFSISTLILQLLTRLRINLHSQIQQPEYSVLPSSRPRSTANVCSIQNDAPAWPRPFSRPPTPDASWVLSAASGCSPAGWMACVGGSAPPSINQCRTTELSCG